MNKKSLNSSTCNSAPRTFVLVYTDFLTSDLLTAEEKILYIVLLSFASNKTMQAYPSQDTLARITGFSRRSVIRYIESMKQKNVLKVERRTDPKKGNTSNLYTLNNSPALWCGNSGDGDHHADEDMSSAGVREEEQQIRQVEMKDSHDVLNTQAAANGECDVPDRRNHELNAIETKQCSYGIAGKRPECRKKTFVMNERYTMAAIRERYGYQWLCLQKPNHTHEIDSIMQLLYDTLNSNRASIRVQQQYRPAPVVKQKLIDLTESGILYALENVLSQTTLIKSPNAYMLTALYSAEDQACLKAHQDMLNDYAAYSAAMQYQSA